MRAISPWLWRWLSCGKAAIADYDHQMAEWRATLFTASLQFSSLAQSCPTLCDLMDCSTPGFSVHHQLLELAQTHVHRVADAIQPSHPLSSPSPPVSTLSQHQSLFQWVSSSHQVAKVLAFQLQIVEKAREFQKNIHFCFIDYTKSFDCVDYKKLWKILQEMGILEWPPAS